MRVTRGLLLALGGAALGIGTTSPPAGAATGATVAITSPQPGAVLSGSVNVEVAAAGVSGDPPSAIELLVQSAGVTTTVGSTSCNGTSLTCVGTITWNTTGLSGQMTLTAEVTTASGAIATSSAVTVTIDSPRPTATILSPTSGAVVKGTVTVAVVGATDPSQSDAPTALGLFDTAAGATTEIATSTCPSATPTPSTCVAEMTWNTTGLSGTQVLTAEVTTLTGLTATSAPVTLTVQSPVPTAAISSPLPAAIVSGVVNVELNGATDPSESDYPTDLALYDTSGGSTTEVGDYACLANAINHAPTCAGAVTWDTTSAAGPQVLHAVVTTNDGRTGTSAPVTVVVWSRARLTLNTPATVRGGQRAALHGRVVAASDSAALTNVLVRLSIDPAIGAVRNLQTRTNARGAFSFTYSAPVKAIDHVSVPGTPDIGATVAAVRQLVVAPVRCALGAALAGHCAVPRLPAGVPVTLAARLGGTWRTVAHVVSVRAAFAFHLVLPAHIPAGRYPIEALIPASRPYAATTVSLGPLVAP